MIELKPPFRSATPDDSGALAELINFAGEGFPLYVWDKLTQPGEDAWAVGRRRAEREEGSSSYRNAVVAERDGAVIACVMGYSLPEHPKPVDYDAVPAMFAPLEELESLASGTWYLNVLAAYPEFRGQGYGTRLLSIAERLALDACTSEISIIVLDANRRARQLYERSGYREFTRRRIVKEGWRNKGQAYVLLMKKV